MRIHPNANAKGARNRLARQANSKQNGRGKYQHTGPFSFWRTSHRHVLERAHPPTLQQGGSPMLIVLEGCTFAAILRSGSVYYDWAMSWGCPRSVAYSRTWDARGSVSSGLPWRTCAKVQFRDGEAVVACDLRAHRLALDLRPAAYPHVRRPRFYRSVRPRQASQLDPTTRGRISRLAFAFLRGWATA